MVPFLLKVIPNILTFIRIIVIPLIFILIIYKLLIWATLLFLFAALTDFFDGYLARKFHSTSMLGVVFDPIADKILVVVTFIALIIQSQISMWIVIPILLIIIREFVVSGFREISGKYGKSLPVTYFSKSKTALELIAIILLLISMTFLLQWLYVLGVIVLILSAIFAVISAWQYWKQLEAFNLLE